MGVPGLFVNFYTKYKRENELMIELEKLHSMNIDNLFFDFNSVCHPCAHQMISANTDKYLLIESELERTDIIEQDIIEHTLEYTKFIINQINPKNVYIVIDGVAPRSKMNQQRERRYKSEFFKLSNGLWDSNKITPGTKFMLKLNNELKIFKKKNIDNFNCIISDSSEYGEGEHKIMKIISKEVSTSKFAIYGLDADLIFLSIMNKNSDSIILVRDNTFSNNTNHQTMDFVDISNLKKYIYNDFSSLILTFRSKGIFDGRKQEDTKSINQSRLLDDFIVICFLLGNDFLGHLPSINIKNGGMDTIMKAYSNVFIQYNKNEKEPKIFLVENELTQHKINLQFLKDIFYQLKNHESYFFKNFRLNNLAASEIDTLENNINCCFYKEDLIFTLNDENLKTINSSNLLKKRYYTFYEIPKTEACFNYIEGLYWVLGYYKGHTHNNWNWYYKYHNSPFCSDIFEFLRTQQNLEINFINDQPDTQLKQLYMVLPKKSLLLILKELELDSAISFKKFIPYLEEYYPDKIYIDIINKRYLWQSKVLFNNIDDKIIDLLI